MFWITPDVLPLRLINDSINRFVSVFPCSKICVMRVSGRYKLKKKAFVATMSTGNDNGKKLIICVDSTRKISVLLVWHVL